jgi:hypothetical protein
VDEEEDEGGGVAGASPAAVSSPLPAPEEVVAAARALSALCRRDAAAATAAADAAAASPGLDLVCALGSLVGQGEPHVAEFLRTCVAFGWVSRGSEDGEEGNGCEWEDKKREAGPGEAPVTAAPSPLIDVVFEASVEGVVAVQPEQRAVAEEEDQVVVEVEPSRPTPAQVRKAKGRRGGRDTPQARTHNSF